MAGLVPVVSPPVLAPLPLRTLRVIFKPVRSSDEILKKPNVDNSAVASKAPDGSLT